MDKYLFFLLCQYGYDSETQHKCSLALKETITQLQIYQTIKEKELEYRLFAEKKLSKPGFWILTTVISSASTQRIYLSGHNIKGIDSVNLKLGKDSELSFTWTF